MIQWLPGASSYFTCLIQGYRLKKQHLTGVYLRSPKTERPSPDTQAHFKLLLKSCLLTFHWMKQVMWSPQSQGVGMYILSTPGHGKGMDRYSYSKAIKHWGQFFNLPHIQ